MSKEILGGTSSVLFATAQLLFLACFWAKLSCTELSRSEKQIKNSNNLPPLEQHNWISNRHIKSLPAAVKRSVVLTVFFYCQEHTRKRSRRIWWKEQVSHPLLKMLGKRMWCRGMLVKCWCVDMSELSETKGGSAQCTGMVQVQLCCSGRMRGALSFSYSYSFSPSYNFHLWNAIYC